MKKKFILFPVLCAMFYFMATGYTNGPGTFGYERTGASTTMGCYGVGCHGTTAAPTTTVTVELISGGTPVTTYTGGGSYTIRLTGTQTSGAFTLSKFGFQISAVKATTTTNAGTMTAIAGTHLVTPAGVNVVEHTAPIVATTGGGGAGTTYVVNIPWTAPVAGTGSVTLFGVVNAVNADGSADANDKWNGSSLTVTEAATVAPITGTFQVCVGHTTILADATAGGTWSSSAPAVATIDATTGVVTGFSPGVTTISYTAPGGTVTATFTVNPNPAAITGITTLCTGGTTTLADATPGGTWSSFTPVVATIGSTTGVVSGVSAGTSVISYTLTSTGCWSVTTVTVNAPTPISGPDTVCTGATITLTDPTSGGTWSSGTPAVATVGTGGVVTGVAVGSTVISYTLPGGCVASKTIIVKTVPGTISGGTVVCVGTTLALTESVAGGVWSSSNSHATVGSSSGIVTGVSVGTDTIKYTVTNSCGTGTATHIISVHPAGTCTSGLNTVGGNGDNGISVYPNPARSGNFTLKMVTDVNEDAHVVITNILGARIKEFDMTTNNGMEVQLGNVPGIYLLSVTTANGKYVARVAVE